MTAATLKITRRIGDVDGDGVAETARIYQAMTRFANDAAPSTVALFSGRTGRVLSTHTAVADENATFITALVLSGSGRGRGGLLIDRQQPQDDSADLVTALGDDSRVLWSTMLRDDDHEVDLLAGVGDVEGTGHSEVVVADNTATAKSWRGDIRVIDGTTGVATRFDEQRRHGVSVVVAGQLDADRSTDLIVGDDGPSPELSGVVGHHVAGFSVSRSRQLWSERSNDAVFELPGDDGGDGSDLAGDGAGQDVSGDDRSDLVWQHADDIKGLLVGLTVLPGDGSPQYTLGPFYAEKGSGALSLPARMDGEIVGVPGTELPPLIDGGEDRVSSKGYVAGYAAEGRELWRVPYSGDDVRQVADADHDGHPDLQLGEGGPVIGSATGRILHR